MTTGSILKDRPGRNPLTWIIHIFNLSFLLAVNPVPAILLITRYPEVVDSSHPAIEIPWLLRGLEIGGLVLYVMGFFLMAWALMKLGHNYQAGGSAPRIADEMVLEGPYRLVRHPMYTAALGISLGLACLIQSLALLLVFGIYLGLIIRLISTEERRLRQAYGEEYITYQQKVKKLVPLFF